MNRMRVLLFAGLVAAAACSDSANPPTDPTKNPPRSTTTTTATCDPSTIDQAALREALENLFVDGSPDESAGLGKLDNLFHHLNNNRLSVAQEHGWNLLDFIFDKRRAGAIVASSSDIVAFVNALLCLLSIDASISDADNTWLVFPSDLLQTLVTNKDENGDGNPDKWAGTELPPNPVVEPTFVAILKRPDNAPPLDTPFDQHPLFYDFVMSNAGGTGFTKPVVVAVCPKFDLPNSVASDAVLGHNGPDGFEVLDKLSVDFLDCDNAGTTLGSTSRLGRAWRKFTELASGLLLPKKVQASIQLVRRGIGGSTGEWSPFGLVTLKLGSSGGTAAEWTSPDGSSTLTCSPITGPIGSEVGSSCRPQVALVTPLGTPITGTVSFDILSQSISPAGTYQLGLLAPETAGVCGTYLNTTTIVANPQAPTAAPARVCWTLSSTAGANAVGAFVARTGDLALSYLDVDGTTKMVTLLDAAGNEVPLLADLSGWKLIFQATATSLTLTKVAGDNQSAFPGTQLPVPPKVRVTDQNGDPVANIAVSFEPQTSSSGTVATSSAGTCGTFGTTPITVQTDANGDAEVCWTLGASGTNSLLAQLVSPVANMPSVTFTANATTSFSETNSCAVGGSGDNFSYPIRAPALGGTKKVRQVTLYLSSNVNASGPTDYQIALDAYLNDFAHPVGTRLIDRVTLTGKNSEWLPTVFHFDGSTSQNPPLGGRTTDKLLFKLRVLNPGQGTLSYNTGPCGLGGCKPPKGCSVEQLEATTGGTVGAVRRKSVGTKIEGY